MPYKVKKGLEVETKGKRWEEMDIKRPAEKGSSLEALLFKALGLKLKFTMTVKQQGGKAPSASVG